MAHFSKSRNCNAVPVYTSCEDVPIKFSAHVQENEGRAGHNVPLLAVKDTIEKPAAVVEQPTGRTKYLSADGYAVVVSAERTSDYIPVVTHYVDNETVKLLEDVATPPPSPPPPPEAPRDTPSHTSR